MFQAILRGSLILLCSLFLSACQGTPATQTSSSNVDPGSNLIPRQAVFGNPERTQARISPDGSWISWLAPVDGVLNVWLAPADALDKGHPITQDTGRGIHRHLWSADSAYVLYLQDKGGNENQHVFAVDITSNKVRDLTPLDKDSKAQLQGISRNRPGIVLVGLNNRDAQLFDLHEIDISSGKQKLVVKNPGFGGWIIDNELRPRFAIKQQPGGASAIMRRTGKAEWDMFASIPAEDALTTNFISFDLNNKLMYFKDSRTRDKAALVRVDSRDGMIEVLAKGKNADISEVLIDPRTYEVLAYAENYDRIAWTAMNDKVKKDLRILAKAIDGDLKFTSSTDDGLRVIVHADSPQKPGVYYLFDRNTGTVKKLFDTRPQLAAYKLQNMHAIEIPSRDNLTLVSYLTLPEGSDRNNNGIPDKPLPMVLFVHGGPWARDEYGYNTIHQWLADRGYAVLSVNYRGSTGFGKEFLNAAVGEFAGKMHDDLIDAVNWAIRKKVADPDRVAIMGGSYGGYATLVGVTFTPDTFACGVDIVGPSSLVTLVESFPEYWKPFLEGSWFKYVGDPSDDAARAIMLAKSPISRVDDIHSPLLIGQGENDPRVTKKESDQLVDAMNKKDLPVTYVNYPDEGHGFARPENRMSFFAISEAFLAQCLGAQYAPIGQDFKGSSIEVLHGAEYVPGLQEALD